MTGCEQVLVLHNDPDSWDSRRYKLDYQFTVNGASYHGSVTRTFDRGSQIKETIPVRYLSFWPHVNYEGGAGMVVAGPLMLGAGLLLLLPRRKDKRKVLFVK